MHHRNNCSRMCFVVALSICALLAAPALAVDARQAWLGYADSCINAAVQKGEIPGAVLLIGHGDEIVYRKAYGNRSVQPQKTPMTPDTIFDLASVSKVVGTATSVVLLAERGKISYSDKVSKYLPAFAANDKADITIEQLLLHCAGLIPDNSLKDYASGPAKSWENIFNLKTAYPPGTRFNYSDVGYMVLGEIVRVASGKPLDEFARDEIFKPLGMKDTTYKPGKTLKARCAPTEQREGRWMIGEVHDPRAYALGGVAGHAGLFATADDLARYCRMILNNGALDGTRVLSEASVREMIKCRYLPGENGRGYGWDIDTGYSSPRGLLFTRPASFGHTGFTGTSLWLDPVHKMYVILLTNAVHPKDRSKPIVELRRQIGTAAAAALIPNAIENKAAELAAAGKMPRPQPVRADGASAPCDSARGAPANVLCGIDVLERDNFKLLEGRKIAVITNHTGRDKQGRRTIDVLLKAPNVKIVKAFSPEHGFYGTLDEKVGDTVDKETGLRVYSLYGKTRRPSEEMLAGIDTILYDIQDIGTRYYTYPATLGYAMEEAAKRKIKVIVLDRPNPITGVIIDGPSADRGRLGFTAYLPIPVVHGMTIGELAKMFNGQNRIGCDLTVVPVEGWKRDMWWDQTGLLWTNPSPNMRNLTQALVYPITGLLEATNTSVGRGTDQPFEFFGAPWIDAVKLSAALNGANLPGLRFIPFEFTPTSSKFAKQKCNGIYVIVTQREALDPVRSGLTIAWHMYQLFGDKFEVDKVLNLLANAETMQAVKTIKDPAALPALWAGQVETFKKTRERYLMYK